MVEFEIPTAQKLGKIVQLLESFHKDEILYCHWKSNEHLAASMTGDTDLDILFDIHQRRKIEDIFHKLGFKKFDSITQKQYKDIVDFLGMDVDTGKVIHIHTHYRLTLGEPFLKGYQVNFEDQILAGRQFNAEFGIFCIDPAFELVLLFVREALKMRTRDILSMQLGKIQYPDNVLREFVWLRARASWNEIKRIVNENFTFPSLIYPLMSGGFDRMVIKQLRPFIRKEFSSRRVYSPAMANVIRWYREVVVIASRRIARLFSLPVLSKRINPRGGVVIAVVGADGSGKSTITANLASTFGTKLDVYRIYFGRGDGKRSLPRKILLSLKSLTGGRKAKPKRDLTRRDSGKDSKGLVYSIYKCLEALLVVREKKRNLAWMLQGKRKGLMVICDRFPQDQVAGINDGPLLREFLNSQNPVLRLSSRLEKKFYESAARNAPDLVFKLIADADVVEKRKPGETSIEKLNAKIDGIKKMTFDKPCKVVTIDASRTLTENLLFIKNEVWKIL